MATGFFYLFITLQCVWYASCLATNPKYDDKIVFPGPANYAPANRYGTEETAEVPEECKDKQYCTIKPKGYPQERFNNLFKATAPVAQPTLVLSSLDDRQGDPEEVDNCEVEIEFEPLYKVRSKRGDWRTVVQAPEKNYVQMVRLETCKDKSQPCFTVFTELPGYTTFCKQKYSTWEFVVEAEDGSGKTEKISVDLPTCCSCHYKSV